MEDLVYATRFFSLGTEIFREGQPGHLAYLVEDGLVEIDRAIDGKRVPFLKVGPGEIFGEMAVIDGSERMATAVAATDCGVTRVPRAIFNRKVE
ncbi:cyclic nucleotide-binding domain-containing protein, partial [bacterium]